MSDVFFYDPEFVLVEQFGRFVSLNITKKYCGFGTVEIHFPINETRVLEMVDNNPRLLIVSKDVSAVLTGWQIGEDIALFGKTTEWLLTKRAVQPFSLSAKTPEEIARYAVESGAGDFVEAGELLGIGDTRDYATDTVKTVFDAVVQVLEPVKLGFSLEAVPSEKKFVFKVYSGKELSLMLSPSNRTAFDMQYTFDMQNFASRSAWYERKMVSMGDWDAENNQPELVWGAASNAFSYYKITSSALCRDFDGLVCNEGEYLYCDNAEGVWKTCSDIPSSAWDFLSDSTDEGAFRWEAVLSGILTPDEAWSKLSELRESCELETALRHTEYGEDYALGDIVRVQVEFGEFRRSEKKRVAAVNIFYDVDSSGTKPTLESLEE